MNKKTITDEKEPYEYMNINLTPESRIPYLRNTNYVKVSKGDKKALELLLERVWNLHRWNLTNTATGYKAKITSETIKKIAHPSKAFNEYGQKYIDNLNAAVHLPSLFRRAVYLDSRKNQKEKNVKKPKLVFHHFIAPIRMNSRNYRVRIVAREKINSNILYIVEVEVLAEKKSQPAPNIKDGHLMADSDIKVTDLVEGVKIYDYDTHSTRIYHGDDLKFST